MNQLSHTVHSDHLVPVPPPFDHLTSLPLFHNQMDNNQKPEKWKADLWVSMYDEDEPTVQSKSFPHEQIIQSIHLDTLEEFNRKFSSITCDKFAQPEILHHLVRKIFQLNDKDLSPSENKWKIFLTNIFVTAVDKSSLETLEQFLGSRLSVSSRRIKHKDTCKIYRDEHFTLLLNQLTTDERSQVYKNLLLLLMKWAALSPVQVISFLINTALTRPSLIPPICQMMTKQLRPIVLDKSDSFSSSPLITSLLNYSLFHSSNSVASDDDTQDQSKYHSCFVHFIKEFFKARYLKNQSCIINIESIVIEWMSIGNIVPSSVTMQIDILNQLIESNLGGKLLWCNINLLQLLLYFITCIITLRRKANVKEVFLSTIDCIMKRHIQRKITIDQVDQIFNLVKPEDIIILIYFDQYCEDFYISSKLHLYYPQVNKYQLIMMACIDKKKISSINMLPQELSSYDEMLCTIEYMLTFMTKNEINNLLVFLSHHYGIAWSIDVLVSATVKLLKYDDNSINQPIDSTYLIASIDLAIRSCLPLHEIALHDDDSNCSHANDINGNTVNYDYIEYDETQENNSFPLDTHLLCQGDSSIQENNSHENEYKSIIFNAMKRLIDAVPDDSRAIVVQLETDLSTASFFSTT